MDASALRAFSDSPICACEFLARRRTASSYSRIEDYISLSPPTIHPASMTLSRLQRLAIPVDGTFAVCDSLWVRASSSHPEIPYQWLVEITPILGLCRCAAYPLREAICLLSPCCCDCNYPDQYNFHPVFVSMASQVVPAFCFGKIRGISGAGPSGRN